jgi:hypothetical protein
VAAALDEWRRFTLASDPRTPEMVRQILSHWMFEHIHPVADGNGRIGRLLVPLMLRSKGATRAACAFFGEAVHEDKELYVEALKAARLSADMGPWTRLMLSFLEHTAGGNLARLTRLAAVDSDWRRIASEFRSDSMVHKLAPFALTRPVFTLRDALDAIGGTFASVNTAATRLGRGGRADDRQRREARPAVSGGGGAGDIRPVSGGAKAGWLKRRLRFPRRARGYGRPPGPRPVGDSGPARSEAFRRLSDPAPQRFVLEVYALREDEWRRQPQPPRILVPASENRDDLVDGASKHGIPFLHKGPVWEARRHLFKRRPYPRNQRRIAHKFSRDEPMHDQLRGVIDGLSVERRAHRSGRSFDRYITSRSQILNY